MGEIWVPESIAEHRPFTREISPYYVKHDIVCVHTMVGSLFGSWDWANRPGGTYWAFGTSGDGQCIQCHDLQFRSAANLYGNPNVIPIENADMGPGFGPWNGQCGSVPAFTQAQINKLIPLIAWLCKAFNIPPVLIPDTKLGRRGIAYHRQGIDPWRVPDGVLWSKSFGKCCPDDVRIWQLINIIIPGVVKLLGAPAPKPSYQEDDTMLHLIKGKDRPEYFLTDFAGSVRHVRSLKELGEIIWISASNGAKIGLAPNNGPELMSQDVVDSITKEYRSDTAERITVSQINAELKRLTTEVREWQAAVEAAA